MLAPPVSPPPPRRGRGWRGWFPWWPAVAVAAPAVVAVRDDAPDGLNAARGDVHVLPLVQTKCGGAAYGAKRPVRASILFALRDGPSLIVRDLSARCNQRVTAKAVARGDVLFVMIEPVNLRPTTVARCSCYMGVDVRIPSGLLAGMKTVAVYQRGDAYGTADDRIPAPVKVATVRVRG